MFNTNIFQLEYQNRIGNLDIQAKGIVKSNKYFPKYIIDNQEYIFKPLSKTKPLTTPLFSYAEVFWSDIINKYFMPVPLYSLAYCRGYEKEEQKYYDKGCIVPNILSDNQKLINLLEHFNEQKESNVDISNYENFCMKIYDYTDILNSNFIKNNPNLGKQLAYHILVSIVKADENYHYENVSFIKNENKYVSVAPMIDHEFSLYFLFPDIIEVQINYFFEFLEDIKSGVNNKNIEYIKVNYPSVLKEFKEKLQKFSFAIKSLYIPYTNFLEPCSSDNWLVGHALYKEKNENKAKSYNIEFKEIDLTSFNILLQKELKKVVETLQNILSKV